MSVRLYVGNLPEELSRQELEAIFADTENPVSTKIITDRKTNKCRGFGFVTVKSDEQADEFIEKFNGYLINETPIKIEKALPRAKEKDEPIVAEEPTTSSSANEGRRKGASNKTTKQRPTGTQPESSDSVQPDPRWAQDLEKLKQLLAAQTTNS